MPASHECTMADILHHFRGWIRNTVTLRNVGCIFKQLRVSCGINLFLADLYLFDKFPGLVGTGLEVRPNVKGTVKW